MKKLGLLLMILALLSCIAACGNDTTTAPGTTAVPGSTADTTTKPSDVTTSDPVSVEDSGVLLYPSFKDPADDMAAKPLFFWNLPLDRMSEEEVREIVRESYEDSGYAGLGILPYWMDGYMSERYLALYEAALDEGSKYGMQFSLYDENGFPSYTAGGLFAEKYPELTAKRLDMSESSYIGKNGKIFLKIPQGTFMGAVAYNTRTQEMIDISDMAVIKTLPKFDLEAQPVGVMASSTYDKTPGYDIAKAFDGKANTRWNAYQASGPGEYILINYGKKTTVDAVYMLEDPDVQLQRIRSCEVEYWNADENEWILLGKFTSVTDKGATVKFDPVEAEAFRLTFSKISTDSPTISEIKLFSNDQEIAFPGVAEMPSASASEAGYISSGDYSSSYVASMAFDGNMASRWNSLAGTKGNEWVGVKYGKTVTVDAVEIFEALDRITSYKIEYLSGGSWKSCATGTEIGNGKKITFEPISCEGIRLYVNATTGDCPSIFEMNVFYGDEEVRIEEDIENYKGSYLDYPVSGEGWKTMAFVVVSEGCAGMDYLSEEAVKGFIDITYEEYYKHFKKYFDNGTITSAFYDEPSFWPHGGVNTAYGVEGARMWTTDFNEVFAEMFGKEENPILYYAAMWYDIGDKTAEARDKLNAVRTEMFAKHYIGQINDWCEDHGIELMGHMLWEDQDNPVPLHGDLMYCFKYQACPTVDVISYYGMSEDYYKIVSSAAYNFDRPHVGVEAYGAINGMPVNVLYKQAMDLFAKGINVMVPHAIWYSATENVVFPPELSYRTEPYASELPQYNDYIARLQTMLQEGRHVADIAVLYPIDTLEYTYDFNKGYGREADSNYIALTDLLSEKLRLDYTYLHPSVLDEKVNVNGNTLHLDNKNNYEDYKVMILPSLRVISKSNLEKIYDFYKNGGIVISVGTLPTKGTKTEDDAAIVDMITEMFGLSPDEATKRELTKTNDKGGKLYHLISIGKLGQVLKSAYRDYDVLISSVLEKNGHFTYIHKALNEKNIYFFANSSDIAVNPTITLRGEFSNLEVWDPMTGEKKALETTVKDGMTTFNLKFEAVTSFFVVEGE